MRRTTVVIFMSFMLLYSISNAIAQVKKEDIPFGKTIAIFSKILDEERQIYIYLPFGYDSNLKRYPVLYLTDGRLGAFRYYAGVIQYYNRTYFPEFIVVGIPNTDRGRDLSPNKWEQIPQSGGGKNFLDFITDELNLLIDGSFRTTDYRLIAGFSAGGNFVLYTLFEKPEFFNAFIAASASNNDHQYMIKKAREFIGKNTTAEKFLFLPYFEGDFTICTESVPKDASYSLGTKCSWSSPVPVTLLKPILRLSLEQDTIGYACCTPIAGCRGNTWNYGIKGKTSKNRSFLKRCYSMIEVLTVTPKKFALTSENMVIEKLKPKNL